MEHKSPHTHFISKHKTITLFRNFYPPHITKLIQTSCYPHTDVILKFQIISAEFFYIIRIKEVLHAILKMNLSYQENLQILSDPCLQQMHGDTEAGWACRGSPEQLRETEAEQKSYKRKSCHHWAFIPAQYIPFDRIKIRTE